MLKDCPGKGKRLTHFHYSPLKDAAVPPAARNFAVPVMGSLCTVRVSKQSDNSSAVCALQQSLAVLSELSATAATAEKRHWHVEHRPACLGTSPDTARLWMKELPGPVHPLVCQAPHQNEQLWRFYLAVTPVSSCERSGVKKIQRSPGTVSPLQALRVLSSSMQKRCNSSDCTQVELIATGSESSPCILVISSSCKEVAKSAWRLFSCVKRGNTTVLMENGPIPWYFVSEQSKMAQRKVLVN